MNNQEKTVHEYLSGYFGVDLNESIDSLTESDIRDAVQDLNTLVLALNEQRAGFGRSVADRRRRKERDLEDRETFDKFDNLLSGINQQGPTRPGDGSLPKLDGRGLAGLEDKMGVPKDERFRYTTKEVRGADQLQTGASVKDMQDRLDKYEVAIQNRTDRAKSTLAAVRATSQRNQAKRDADTQVTSRVGDPDRHAFLVKQGATPTGKSTGYAGDKTDSASFTLDDKLKFHVSKAAEKRQKKGDFSLPGGGYDYAAMAQSIRESRTLREQSGGASMYPVIPRRNTTQGTLSPEEVKSQKDALAQAVADNPTSRAAMDAAAQHQQDTRPDREIRAAERTAHKDRVKVELVNNARGRRGMGPLGANEVVGTQASNAAAQKTIQDRYAAAVAKRASFGTTPPGSPGVMGPPSPTPTPPGSPGVMGPPSPTPTPPGSPFPGAGGVQTPSPGLASRTRGTGQNTSRRA